MPRLKYSSPSRRRSAVHGTSRCRASARRTPRRERPAPLESLPDISLARRRQVGHQLGDVDRFRLGDGHDLAAAGPATLAAGNLLAVAFGLIGGHADEGAVEGQQDGSKSTTRRGWLGWASPLDGAVTTVNSSLKAMRSSSGMLNILSGIRPARPAKPLRRQSPPGRRWGNALPDRFGSSRWRRRAGRRRTRARCGRRGAAGGCNQQGQRAEPAHREQRVPLGS